MPHRPESSDRSVAALFAAGLLAQRFVRRASWCALGAALTASAFAAQISRDTATRAAATWLARNPAPMGIAAGQAGRVETCVAEGGDPLFHVIHLDPVGYVVIAADNQVEPVLAFSSRSPFIAEAGAPLFDLLKRDARARIATARRQGQLTVRSASTRSDSVERRWAELLGTGTRDAGENARARGIADVSDVCVAPMVTSRWDQVSAVIPASSPDGAPTELFIYNYYAPPYWPGSPYNYTAGCSPVAWAQIMRFHRWPDVIGATAHDIGIDGWSYSATMMGGDGLGGPYEWDQMPLEPGLGITPEQTRAIGALMFDAGIGINAHYTYYGTYATTTIAHIKKVFRYAEAKLCEPSPGLEELMKALRTSLDARLPANLDIFTETRIGHSLVIDGYGYNGGTRYYHMNLGWSGHSDGWYNFPPVDVVLGDGSPEFFTIITALKYNIDPSVAGEMITGRITDTDGSPVSGATVTLSTTPARAAISNRQGLYAFKGLAANTTAVVTVAADGYLVEANRASITTGDSAADVRATGNRTADFRAAAVAVTLVSEPGTRLGSPAVLSVSENAAQPVRWLRNGAPLAIAAERSLAFAALDPAQAGLYALEMTNGVDTVQSAPSLLAVNSTAKVAGAGREVLSNAYVPSNGNTFDQVLLEGSAASVKADSADRQITRISFVDLDDDIVQVEFSGPGTLTVTLDQAAGPARPLNYNQDVSYMKGHAGIVIAGATQDSHVSVFSVGKATAANQTLFKSGVNYDGIADLAFIAIASDDGKFGGVRAANANFFAARGVTGLYAPGVAITGPLFLGDIVAFDAAKPMIRVRSATDVRITGGDLYQENGQPVQVSGLTRVAFREGADSHGNALPAKINRAVLLENGTDVTADLVAAP